MSTNIKQVLSAKDQWLRGLYMLLFLLVNYFVRLMILGIVFFQFLIVLFTGKTNENCLNLGKSLSTFSYQIMLYLTYNSEEKPYPFGPWPVGK